MKTIGLIGGLGPEATVDYYKKIITSFMTTHGGLTCPEIIIYSVNFAEFLELISNKQWQKLTELLLEKISLLHNAGAEFAAIASNTPHIVFNEIASESPIPLISIIESTFAEARKRGLKKAGLIGTKITMETDLYKTPFKSRGISVVVPSEEEQQMIHHKLFSEIELGIFKDSTREELLSVVKRMVDDDCIDSLILGCTELPLILTKEMYGIPFLNTSHIHCQSIINYCIGK